MDKIFQLFREYLSNVEHIPVRLSQNRTDKGTIYELHGEEPKDEGDLNEDFREFTRFLDICITDQETAEKILQSKGIDRQAISEILIRYSKEARRLKVDLKHERERRMLSIKQNLETELIDVVKNDEDWLIINKLISNSLPEVVGPNSVIAFEHGSQIQSLSQSITINVNPQIIDQVNGIVAGQINGDQHIGEQGKELLALIEAHGKSKELASAVYEIEDETVPKPDRLKAKQKLKKFLLGLSRRSTDVAVGVLQSYIEAKLGL